MKLRPEDLELDPKREVNDAFMWPTIIVFVAAVALLVIASCAMSGCSTHNLVTPSGINATSSEFLYCPAKTELRIKDDNRTIVWTADESGVGTVVQSLGDDVSNVLGVTK